MTSKTVLIGVSESRSKYYILEGESKNGRIYGIMVSGQRYAESLPGLFEDRDEAVGFAEKIMKNDLSPLHVSEAADDYFSAWGGFWDRRAKYRLSKN